MKRLLPLIFCGLLLSACAARQPQPLGVTFVPVSGDFIAKDGTRLTLNQVLDLARDADYVLIGEGHKNVCDHAVQQEILRALASGPNPPALGLEMVADDRQGVLDAFFAGKLTVDDLEQRLDWTERWGYTFELYRGLFQIARQHKLPVAGLNAPPQIVRKVSREGLDSLTDEERGMIPAHIIRQPAEQEGFLKEIMFRHEGRDTTDPAQVERFFLVQSLWDTQMATRAVWARRTWKRPVVVMAGSGHVDFGWGVALRLNTLDYGAKVLAVTPWRGVEGFEPGAADAFFYCPNTYVSRMGMTLEENRDGLRVVEVQRGSRADQAGLRPGDLLVAARGRALHSLDDLHVAGTRAYKDQASLTVTVLREKDKLTIDLGKLGEGR